MVRLMMGLKATLQSDNYIVLQESDLTAEVKNAHVLTTLSIMFT
jgi:hypothetical protein